MTQFTIKCVFTFILLLQLLRQCILKLESPVIDSPLGQPPFEKLSIHKGVSNLVMYKFSHLAQQERQMMYKLASNFFYCLNTWDFPSPSTQKQFMTQEEAIIYKLEYTRYISTEFYFRIPFLILLFSIVDG